MMRTDDSLSVRLTGHTPRRTPLANFLLMSFFFSVNHGCVSAVLNISVQLLGDAGSYQSGALYITYAATALLFSAGMVDSFGPRISLMLGSALNTCYVISLPIALITPLNQATLRVVVSIAGGLIGGFAAGFLWTAQGTYFTLSAVKHASHAKTSLPNANAALASYFASIFLGLELVLKMLPIALIPLSDRTVDIFGKPVRDPDLIVGSLYSALAIAAVFGLTRIDSLPTAHVSTSGNTVHRADPSDAECHLDVNGEARDTSPATSHLPASLREHQDELGRGGSTIPRHRSPTAERGAGPHGLFNRMGAVTQLWSRRPVVLLLAPIQVAFGVSAALLGYQVTGKMVKESFGSHALVVGSLLSALVSLSAAILQPVSRYLSPRLGKPPIMLAGLLAFVGLATLVHFSPAQLAAPAGLVVLPFYLLQGVGRACYEGTNKALYADIFGANDSPAAFSNIVLANGLASSAAYFAFPKLSKQEMATVALVCSLIAVGGYLVAEVVHRTQNFRGGGRE